MRLYVTLTQLFGWTHIYQLNFRHPHIFLPEKDQKESQMQSKLGSLVAFIKIAIAVIFSVYRNGGGHRTENMTFCEIIVWLFTSYETPFIHISWYPYLDIYVESIIQMDRKRMTSIWALFRISLLPFTYLRTKNPGSKKCIERSQEGRISLSWGRGQKENDVFHRAETLKRKSIIYFTGQQL